MKDNGLLVQYFTANTTDSQDLWKKAAEDAAVLKKMGATAVWFPPATKGAQGKEDMGYAPYDLYDLGEFDQKGSVGTRYGTKDEYIAAIKAMKDQGINVYADIAVRQKLGADRIEKVTAADFNTKDIPQMIGNKKTVGALSKFTFPGRKSKYSKFKWNWKHFAGIDWKQEEFKKRVCALEGKDYDEANKEYSKYDYIIGSEIDFYNQEVYDELMAWAQWYEKTTDVDGFRFQEAEAIPAWFVKDFIEATSDVPTAAKKKGADEAPEYVHKDIFAVGDFWHWNTEYLEFAIPAFRLTASGVKPETQIHTHMCYSEFTDIIPAIDDMDADVITFEASRSDLQILDSLRENNFETEVGPGVYDIHSPRIPSVEEITRAIKIMLTKIDKDKLWVNPDCGLKTRGVPETEASLKNMVKAAEIIRAEL